MPNRFLNNITINDEYTLPSADGTADQIITTDGAGQLSFVDQSTINAGNAEHVVIYAKNTSGASISKGTPVYITGTVGATDTVQIAPADASDSAKMPAVGLLDDTLANNAFGYVITGGFMDNITTDPIDGSTPSSNDTVYVKSGGGLTLTKPTGSNLIQNVAKVGKVSGGNSGSLIVSSILRTNDVPNLTTGKIWVGTANNTAESGVVHLDETNGRIGIGTTSPATLLHSSTHGATAVTNELRVSSTTTGGYGGTAILNLLSSQYGNSGVYFGDNATYTSQPAYVKFVDVSNLLEYNSSGSHVFKYSGSTVFATNATNFGIGTTSPSQKLDVVGSAQITGDLYLGRYIFHDGDTNTWIGFPSNDTITLRTNNSDRIRVASTGYVGINESSANARLQVKESSITTFTGTGSSAQLRLRGGYTSNEYIIIGFAQDSNKDIGRMAVKRGGSGSSFHWGTSNNYGNGVTAEVMVLDKDGNLQIDGTLTESSDERLKENINNIDNALDKVKKLRGVTYNRKNNSESKIGLIAQEVEAILPQLVSENDEGYKSVAYTNLTALLVEAIKEQQAQVEELKNKING